MDNIDKLFLVYCEYIKSKKTYFDSIVNSKKTYIDDSIDNMYSFSLSPASYKPSGSVNFSYCSDFYLKIKGHK